MLEILLEYFTLINSQRDWAVWEMNVESLHVLESQLLHMDLLHMTAGPHVPEKCSKFMPMAKVTTLSLTWVMTSFSIMWLLTPGCPL